MITNTFRFLESNTHFAVTAHPGHTCKELWMNKSHSVQ